MARIATAASGTLMPSPIRSNRTSAAIPPTRAAATARRAMRGSTSSSRLVGHPGAWHGVRWETDGRPGEARCCAGTEEARVHLDTDEALRRAAAADHGVLATLDRNHGASLVPACFAIDGDRLAIPIDSVKPKGSTALGRVRNLERDPRASLLIEHWDPVDWSRLWWVHLLLVRTAQPADRVAALVRGLGGT